MRIPRSSLLFPALVTLTFPPCLFWPLASSECLVLPGPHSYLKARLKKSLWALDGGSLLSGGSVWRWWRVDGSASPGISRYARRCVDIPTDFSYLQICKFILSQLISSDRNHQCLLGKGSWYWRAHGEESTDPHGLRCQLHLNQPRSVVLISYCLQIHDHCHPGQGCQGSPSSVLLGWRKVAPDSICFGGSLGIQMLLTKLGPLFKTLYTLHLAGSGASTACAQPTLKQENMNFITAYPSHSKSLASNTLCWSPSFSMCNRWLWPVISHSTCSFRTWPPPLLGRV